jgi:hypothetical protein
MAEDTRKYQRIKTRKINERPMMTHPEWSKGEPLDVYVGQMDAPETLPNGAPNKHRVAYAPVVLIGQEKGVKRGMSPRTARVLARMLLQAADVAEELEISMGWHPTQDGR